MFIGLGTDGGTALITVDQSGTMCMKTTCHEEEDELDCEVLEVDQTAKATANSILTRGVIVRVCNAEQTTFTREDFNQNLAMLEITAENKFESELMTANDFKPDASDPFCYIKRQRVARWATITYIGSEDD
jgi:hypothetical protein